MVELKFASRFFTVAIEAAQHNTEHQSDDQPHEVGDLVGFLQGTSEPGI